MSEELLQRDLKKNPVKFGKWDFYNIGSTSIKALKENNIIRNVDYGDSEKKKLDALIVHRKNVIAVIEYKKPSEFKSKPQIDKAIEQELEVARKLKSKILIATDTINSVWVNVLTGQRIKDENGLELKVNFNAKDENIVSIIQKIDFSINELNNNIKPIKLINPTDLAKQIWQDIWSVSGATPENCLYTFVELFIFKYLSDLGVLQGSYSFNTLVESYETNTPDDVLENYASLIRTKIKTLFPENPLDKTTIINGTIFVSKDQKAVKGYSAVFKKVLLKFKDYGKLENIDYDFKSKLFESFLKESISKKNWGQFFTPLKVVRAILEMAKDSIKEGIKICDPACGVGKFLLEPIATKLDYFYEITKNGIKPLITIHGFDKGFDKDEQKTIILAKANMLIYFSDLIRENPNLTKDFSNLFNNSFTLKTNSILGTLSDPVKNEFDLILTNPPYVTSGSSNLKDEIQKDGELVDYYKINAIGVEGLFVEWIINALKPNGKAFIVIPDGVLDNQNNKTLRQFIIDECFIDSLISLPNKTFFTTIKKTYILSLTKKTNKKEVQKSPVFTYLVSEIGESRDIYRFEIEQNDLQEAVTLFSFFKGNKGSFGKINTDKRCKIQDFKQFADSVEASWLIDNWWTRDEKENLGILEKSKSIRFDDLPQLIEDISNNIKSLQDGIDISPHKRPSKIIFKSFPIGGIFELPSIKGLTKSFIQSNTGSIPVYGGRQEEEPIGCIKDNIVGVKYFENCLAWNREGSVGYVFWHKHKFTTNDHHRPLIVKDIFKDKIDLDFMRFTVQDVLLSQGFRWSKTASKEKVDKLTINLPVNSAGDIDLATQKIIADKYRKIEEIKLAISNELIKLSDSKIEFV
jgi:type I restriction-modification system DNA methylase subunit